MIVWAGVSIILLALVGGICHMKRDNEELIEANELLQAKYEGSVHAYAAIDLKYKQLFSRYRALKQECFDCSEIEKALREQGLIF